MRQIQKEQKDIINLVKRLCSKLTLIESEKLIQEKTLKEIEEQNNNTDLNENETLTESTNINENTTEKNLRLRNLKDIWDNYFSYNWEVTRINILGQRTYILLCRFILW